LNEKGGEAIASAQNNRQVDLPENAAWKEDFIRELEEFPLSEHDDCVDAYTWAQAGFVRGEGFFKPPSLPDGGANTMYDSVLDSWDGYDFGSLDLDRGSNSHGDLSEEAVDIFRSSGLKVDFDAE
jgi:hypothetical protein